VNTSTDSTTERFVALDGWDLFAEKLLEDVVAKTLSQAEGSRTRHIDEAAISHSSTADGENAALIPEIVSPSAADERRSSPLPARLDPSIGATSVAAEVVDRSRRQAEILERRRQSERSRIHRLLRRSDRNRM